MSSARGPRQPRPVVRIEPVTPRPARGRIAHTWLTDLRRQGYSPATIENRRYALNRFLAAVGRDPRYARREHWDTWWQGLDRLGPSARAVELSHLRAYCRWLVRQDHLKSDPTARFERVRVPQALPRPATDEQVRRGIEATEGQARTVLMLGAFAGLRCMEIAQLRWEHIDLHVCRCDPYRGWCPEHPAALTVFAGKGGKDRRVPLHPRLAAELTARIEPRGPVVTGARGQAINAGRVSHLGNRALHAADLAVSMHQLRHWFGTTAEEACGDIGAVADLMGHSSVRTTAQYVKINARRGHAVIAAMTDPLGTSA